MKLLICRLKMLIFLQPTEFFICRNKVWVLQIQLRAVLRQDPDVLLIGEIRDEETANIAVKAALTGHLVLSTLHNSDAVTAIQRLLNLGIAPDLLAETLTVIVSQRLVRRLCSHQN